MYTFTVSRDIPQDPKRAWALLDNFADVWTFNPNLKHSESVNGLQGGLGAERLCVLHNGAEVQERVTEHDADAMRYRLELFEFGGMPLSTMEAELRVEPIESGSRVVVDGAFEPLPGVDGAAMVGQFESLMAPVLEGLEKHLASGRIILADLTLGDAVAA